ncbi:hypothetical protein D3C85_1020620 [compost metagenome]
MMLCLNWMGKTEQNLFLKFSIQMLKVLVLLVYNVVKETLQLVLVVSVIIQDHYFLLVLVLIFQQKKVPMLLK